MDVDDLQEQLPRLADAARGQRGVDDRLGLLGLALADVAVGGAQGQLDAGAACLFHHAAREVGVELLPQRHRLRPLADRLLVAGVGRALEEDEFVGVGLLVGRVQQGGVAQQVGIVGGQGNVGLARFGRAHAHLVGRRGDLFQQVVAQHAAQRSRLADGLARDQRQGVGRPLRVRHLAHIAGHVAKQPQRGELLGRVGLRRQPHRLLIERRHRRLLLGGADLLRLVLEAVVQQRVQLGRRRPLGRAPPQPVEPVAGLRHLARGQVSQGGGELQFARRLLEQAFDLLDPLARLARLQERLGLRLHLFPLLLAGRTYDFGQLLARAFVLVHKAAQFGQVGLQRRVARVGADLLEHLHTLNALVGVRHVGPNLGRQTVEVGAQPAAGLHVLAQRVAGGLQLPQVQRQLALRPGVGRLVGRLQRGQRLVELLGIQRGAGGVVEALHLRAQPARGRVAGQLQPRLQAGHAGVEAVGPQQQAQPCQHVRRLVGLPGLLFGQLQLGHHLADFGQLRLQQAADCLRRKVAHVLLARFPLFGRPLLQQRLQAALGRLRVGRQHALDQIQFIVGQFFGLLQVILLRLAQGLAGRHILLAPAIEDPRAAKLGHLVGDIADRLPAGLQVAEAGEGRHLALLPAAVVPMLPRLLEPLGQVGRQAALVL